MITMNKSFLTALAAAFLAAVCNSPTASAQSVVGVDLNATWSGYMNVFNNDGGSQGSYVFGGAWGVNDVKSTINAGAMTLTLQPNFNTYADNPNDPFWRDNNGAGPGGNKWMEGNTFIENLNWGGGELTFQGNILSSAMLSPNYSVSAFIKSFGGGFAFSQDFIANGATDFSVTHNAPAGMIQYGFLVAGLNANPANEVALGSVVVQGVPEPSTYAMLALGAAGLGAHLYRRRRR